MAYITINAKGEVVKPETWWERLEKTTGLKVTLTNVTNASIDYAWGDYYTGRFLVDFEGITKGGARVSYKGTSLGIVQDFPQLKEFFSK